MDNRPTFQVNDAITSSEVKAVQVEKKNPVFLAWVTPELDTIRTQLQFMLEKAGFDVYPKVSEPSLEPEFVEHVAKALEISECSIHLLGAQFGRTIKGDPYTSLAKYQYENAGIMSKRTSGKFKRFVWNYPLKDVVVQEQQALLIDQILNSLSDDVIFTNTNSSAQFIDDLIATLDSINKEEILVKKEYDISFISNVQDAGDCYEIVEKLNENYKLSTLTVVPEQNLDYRTEAIKMLRKAKMTIVFFKESSDWALAFVKQVWKLSGGASNNTPILLIGEDEPRRNRFIKFKAPQLLLSVSKKENIYAKILEVYNKVSVTGKIVEETFSPYTGLRPFNENESIYFKGRDKHIDAVIQMLEHNKYVMVTGASGDGKSSLIYAGVIPNAKAGFLKGLFTKWTVVDFKPERSPLRNLAAALSQGLRLKNVDEVELQLGYGFSALVDIYKKSDAYCDMTSIEWADADEETRRAMKRKASNLLILVDQFEEFFTNSENYRDGVASPVSQITINVLQETIKLAREEQLPIYVVFTMRSDYIGQCVAFRGFAELIGNSTYFVPRLKREEIQEVIQAPAILNGDKISLRLTQRILNDLGDGTDQLPVLQHALYQMWKEAHINKEEIDIIHYAKVGGIAINKLPASVQPEFELFLKNLPEEKKYLFEKPRLRNVLSKHANELYETAHEIYNQKYQDNISKEEAQKIIKTTFVCLTKIDENRAVRNRMSLMEIYSILGNNDISLEKFVKVINIFRETGNSFIQPFITDDEASRDLSPDAVMDITHESLIRNWDLLVEWAEEEHKSVSIFRDFKVQVNQWLENEKDPKYLLNSGLYTYFNAWWTKAEPNAFWILRYMAPEEINPMMEPAEQAAIYHEDCEEFLFLSKQKIDRNRRLVLFAISLISTLLIVSLIAAWMALQSKYEADAQREIAIEKSEYAEIQRDLAIKKEKEAEFQRMVTETEKLKAETQAIIAENQKKIAEGEKIKAETQRKIAENQKKIAENERKIAEQQRKIAEENEKEAKKQTKIAEEKTKLALEKEEEARKQAEIAKKQRNNALITQSLFLASQAEQQVDENRPDIGILLAREALPKNLQDPDRPYVEEAEAALYYSINKIANKDPLVTLNGHKNKMIYNLFSPDGKRLVSTSWDKTARLWDIETGRQLGVLQGHNHIVEAAKFSKDGKTLATLADDFTARLWDFQRFNLLAVFRGHKNTLTSVDISNDGKRVATSSIDKTARIWDAATGDVQFILEGHTGHVLYTAFNNNSDLLITTSADSTAKLWDVKTGKLINTLVGHQGAIKYATFSPDDKYIATVSKDFTCKLWDGKTGKFIKVFRGHHDVVNHVAFSHNGELIVTSSKDSTAKVWNVATGEQVGNLKGHLDNVYKASFSPDDKRIVTNSDDKSARLWDGKSFLRLAVFKGSPGLGYACAFSPDSKRMAMAGPHFSIEIYRVFPNLQELIDYSENFATRPLTDEEKKRFFVSDFRVRKEIVEEIKKNENYQNNLDKFDLKDAPNNYDLKEKPDNKPQDSKTSSTHDVKTQTKPAFYTVRPNQTLSEIAKKFNVTEEYLMKINNLDNPKIEPGQILKVK